MRPARPSTQRKSPRRPIQRRSVVVSQRSGRSFLKRRTRPTRKPSGSGSFYSSVAAFFRVVGMVLVIAGLLVAGGYVLLKQVLLPSLVFTQKTVQLKVFAPADEPSKLVVLRVQPVWQDSQILTVTDAQISLMQHPHPERAVSQELGILVSQVENIPTVAKTQASLFQRLANTQSANGLAFEQLSLVAAKQSEVPTTLTATEFRENSIVPILNPNQGAVCPVAVRNTTPTAGMAEAASAMLERSGLLVVRTASATVPKAETSLRISAEVPEECLEVAQKIQQALSLPVSEPEVDSQLEFDQFRAGMILELGEDWQKNEIE